MTSAGKIRRIVPQYAIPGGEVSIEGEHFRTESGGMPSVTLDGESCRITAASSRRVLTTLPFLDVNGKSSIVIESGGHETEPYRLTVGRMLAEDMHIVAN